MLSWTDVFLTLVTTGLLLYNGLQVEAHSNGQDIDEACQNMVPSHNGAKSQTSLPPFSVTFTPDSYTPGTPVSVTIKACTATNFKGFLIEARRATKGTDQNDILGSFTPDQNSGTQFACQNKGLVHTSNSEKSTLTFNWTPPSTTQGHIQFRVTFVQEFEKFWTAVTSAVLKDKSITAGFDPTSATPPTPLAPACSLADDRFLKDSDCKVNNCFSDCAQTGCTFLIKFQQVDDYGEYTIKTQTVPSSDMYAAVGLSNDQSMGNDGVTGCIYTKGKAQPFNAYNDGYNPKILASDGVNVTTHSYENGIFLCTFKRVIASGLNGQRFDLNQSWYLLFARGKYDNKLEHHAFRQASSQKYLLTGSSQVGTTPPPITQVVPSGEVSLPAGCGSTKGCVSKCSGSSCDTVISWEEDDDYVLYTLSSVVVLPHFMAIGFSSDDKMGQDSVSGCAAQSESNVRVFSGFNEGKRPSLFEDSNVTVQKYSTNDNVLSCTIRRMKIASSDGKRFDVTKKWVILFAKGKAEISSAISLKYHGNNVMVSPGKFSSEDRPNVGAETPNNSMVKAHGSLMIGAWIFFASIGIIVARYYKPVWKTNFFSLKVWFQIHRTCMVLVFCSTSAGFIIIFVEVKDWSEINAEQYLESHPILGVIVTALTVLNPIMALFRPHPGTENRWIFNWAHWFVGNSAYILGVITIFFGVKLGKARAPDSMVTILACFVAWQILITLTLEIIQFINHTKTSSEVYDLSDEPTQKMQPVEETVRTQTIKRIILFIHVFALTIFTAILISFLCIGEEDLD